MTLREQENQKFWAWAQEAMRIATTSVPRNRRGQRVARTAEMVGLLEAAATIGLPYDRECWQAAAAYAAQALGIAARANR